MVERIVDSTELPCSTAEETVVDRKLFARLERTGAAAGRAECLPGPHAELVKALRSIRMRVYGT